MKIKQLGRQGIQASELGLGCMGMSEFYGTRNDEESVRVIHRAFESGIIFLIRPICTAPIPTKY